MLKIKENLIDNVENSFMLSSLEDVIDHTSEREDLFYEWYAINPNNKIFENTIFQKVFNKNLLFAEFSYGKPLRLNYMGFAYQTKGFDYHADAVWPSDEENRDLGTPTIGENTYKNYTGEWVPNYVPTRKYTTVLYLNDDFSGGDTHFPTLNISIKPEKNKIVGFGCDENYIHGVMPTIGGIRKSFLCWFE